jgi:PAS domain S-box-containing protein
MKRLAASHVSVCIEAPRGLALAASAGEARNGDALAIHTARRTDDVTAYAELADTSGAFGSFVAVDAGSLAQFAVATAEITPLARNYADEVAHAHRVRLALAEQDAMRAALESDTPRVLTRAMAKIVRRGTQSDLASVFVPPASPSELSGAIDSPRRVTPEQWDSLRQALRGGGGDPLFRTMDPGGYARADLEDGGPLSPVERWTHTDGGSRSIAVRMARSARTAATVTVSLANHEPTTWSEQELAFVARAAQLTLTAVERLRDASLAPWLQQRTRALASLLGSLGDWRPMRNVAATFVQELEVRFGVRCLAITRSATEDAAGRVLWAARGMELPGREQTDSGIPTGLARDATPVAIRDGASAVGVAWVDAGTDLLPAAIVQQMEEVLETLGVIIGQGRRLRALDAEQRGLQATAGLLSALAPEATTSEFARIFAGQARRYFRAAIALVATFSADAVQIETLSSDSVTVADLEKRDDAGHAPIDALRERALETFASRDVTLDAPDDYGRLMASHGIRSVMRAPMLGADGTRRGIVMVGSSEPSAWSPRQQQALRGFASALGFVVERERVVHTMRRQEERRRAVLGLLAALGPRENVSQVADPLCAAIRRMYDADHCSIGLIEAGQIKIAGFDSSLMDVTGFGTVAADGLFLERFARTGYDLVPDITELAARPPVVEQLIAGGVRSMLRVLIGAPAAPVGILAVASRRPGALTIENALELREIARPLAVVIDYFERRRESERRAERLAVMNRALEALTYAGTSSELASAFLHECRTLFESTFGVVVRWDRNGRPALVAADAADGFIAADGRASVPAANPLVGITAPRLLVHTDAAPANAKRLAAAGMHHGLAAPLMSGTTSIGAVVLWTRRTGPSHEDDLALLATLTRPLSIALQRVEATASLAESESKYRSLIARAEEMIYLFDGESLDIIETNAYGARILGYSEDELCGLKVTEIVDDTAGNVRANTQRALDEGELRLPARSYRRRDGSIVVMDIVASTISLGGRQAVLVLGRDVSERHVIEQRLIQGQKMEALGQMAGNVAHDFNNLLTTVLGFAGLLKRAPGMEGEALEYLGLIEDAARRAADLSSRMLSFARGGLVKFGPVDLRSVIEQTLRLAEAGMPSTNTVRPRLPAEPVIVEGDAGQLQQALLNIVINARDAMPGGGTLTVRLRAAGDGCVLSIADTGAGMTEETRMRLFEPFYTTKPPGSGTGLGMAITYGIVQGHHGAISATTALGHGTTFSIRLPLFDPDAIPMPPAPAPGATPSHGAILVVDDDDLVRRTMTATLVDLGYAVVPAGGGAEAVALVKADPERFAAVVLDLVMAGMSGSATFHALQGVRKDLPVIICTGYADDDHVDVDVQRGAAAVIYKPFNPDGLARALQLAGAFPVVSSQ